MNTDEAMVLVAHLGSLDHRHLTATALDAEVKAASWAQVLATVPLPDALAVTTRLYSTEQQRAITPGEILRAWQDRARNLHDDPEADRRVVTRYPYQARRWESYVEWDDRARGLLSGFERDQATAWAVQQARAVLPAGADAGRVLRETVQTLADGHASYQA